jgi:hypothetical protein
MNIIVLGHQNLIQLSRSKLYNYFLRHLSSYLSQQMGNHYSNIVVYNVDRVQLINYLSTLHRTAFISPTVNKFIAIYDRDISASFQEHLFSIKGLTKNLDCDAIAAYLHDGTEFGYKLYSRGEIVDTYVSVCPESVIINQHDRAKKIVKMFECQTNWRQILKILSNPISPVTISHYDNYYRFGIEYLIDSNFFPSEQDRHEALSMKIGIDPCWFVGIDYNNIIYGDLEAHFSDLELDVEESIAMLTAI